ncbi:TPA: hypothetical protein DF272_02620 [Candidatus Falkowbacteria bacterium]|nr:hypothetical protein [Candidatus Falkowbacteria bacterium]
MRDVDMHTHSHYSDGADSPCDVVRKAKEAGLKAVCLTDHDSHLGLDEFAAALKEFDLDGLAGIEVSVYSHGEVLHLLGYGINHTGPAAKTLNDVLQTNWRALNSRIIEAMNKYRAAGLVDVTPEEMQKTVGAKGPIQFKLWLRDYRQRFGGVSPETAKQEQEKGGVAHASYDKKRFLSPDDGIKLIHEIGGVAVWAHSGRLLLKDSIKHELIFTELLETGLDGLETEHAENRGVEYVLVELANRNNLIRTGGSDYHGRHKPKATLGNHGITHDEFLALRWRLGK